jgi:hypothetical protein
MVKQRAARQYLGVLGIDPPGLTIAERAPTSADRAFNRGQLWLDIANSATYQYPGSGDWITLGSGTAGGVVSLTGDSGGAIVAVGGNIDVVGDATDGTSVVGTAGTLTINVEQSSTTQRGTVELATDAEAVTGTDADRAITAAALTARLAEPGAIGGTTPAAGSFTTLATSGDYTATTGDVIINSAGQQLQVHGGAATDFIGTATLVNGTVTVLNTNIAATDRIFVERSAVNASTALGLFKVVKTAATNFVITACKPADATTETGDLSTVEYFIVRQV